MGPVIRVQAEVFDPGAELSAFAASRVDIGAVVSFTGIVRDERGSLEALEIEHYPAMTKDAIARIAEEAVTRWSLAQVLIIHRFGQLVPGAPIMMVACAAAHRSAAFEAADFLMDYLKSRAPFWKKEVWADSAAWVAAKDADEAALARWTARDAT